MIVVLYTDSFSLCKCMPKIKYCVCVVIVFSLLKQDKENAEKFDLRRHLSWCPWINAVSDKSKCISERLCHYIQLELKKKRRSDSEVRVYSRFFIQSIHVTLSCSWMFYALRCKSLTQYFVSSSLFHSCQSSAIDDWLRSDQLYMYKQHSMVVLQWCFIYFVLRSACYF